MKKSFFAMLDGLDGSGKGTVMQAFKEFLQSKGLKVLDVKEYSKKYDKLPETSEIRKYDVILSAEPTYCGIGKKIREEIIASGSKYTVFETAKAFAEDREQLYRQVIIPALQQRKYVFQDRGIISSIVYQPAQGDISLNSLLKMPGNKLALAYTPDYLIIMKINPKIACSRFEARKKQDNVRFETLEFQKKIQERYESRWLRQLFENHGSKVIYLDTNSPKTEQDTKNNAMKLIEQIMR